MPVLHHGSFVLINWNVCSYMPMKTHMHVVMAHQRLKLQCTSDQLREKDPQRTVRMSAVLAPLLFTHTDSVSSLIFNLADKPLILTDLALNLLPNSNDHHPKPSQWDLRAPGSSFACKVACKYQHSFVCLVSTMGHWNCLWSRIKFTLIWILLPGKFLLSSFQFQTYPKYFYWYQRLASTDNVILRLKHWRSNL